MLPKRDRSSYMATYRRKRWAILRDVIFGGKCFHCGIKHGIRVCHFAHIEPTRLNGRGRGQDNRYYDILRNQNKYALLCGFCHSDMDNGKEERPF